MNRFCNTNNYSSQNMDNTSDVNPALETVCNNVSASNNYGCSNKNKCSCGFNEGFNVFPTNPMLAQSYVPFQIMTNTFTPQCGLKNGTIFPELVSPYFPCQSVEDIEYIRSRNSIGKGCNSCY